MIACRNHCLRLFAILTVLAIGLAPTLGHGQVAGIVSQVTQASYQNYHLTVENMGLGLYGGSTYNMGYRNRDGWSGLGTLGNQETRLYLENTFASMGLNVTTQGSYRNVIGELPGRTTPERLYIVGAHYDHLAGDRPGGDDNASGTAGILEAARVLSQYRFDSTIRFVAFNAEEDGLLGSKHYVNNVIRANSQNLVGMINLDMILRPGFDNNGNGVIDLDLSTRTSHSPSVAWAVKFRQAANTYVPALPIDAAILNENGGSDQDPFVVAGYPAFLASEHTAPELFGGANAYYHSFHDATNRLANNPNSPSGVTFDYPFATNTTRAVVALLAQEAGFRFALTPCDFNIDGACDLSDLNALLQVGPVAPGVAVVPGVTTKYDLTGNGVIDNADVDQWLAGAATQRGFATPLIRGDANLDGVVDGSDFGLWNSGKSTSTLVWNGGDFNGDGVADGSDFGVWNANKFTASSPLSPVPEPSLWLGITVTMVWIVCRPRRG